MSMEYSVPIYWRNRHIYYKLLASRCKKCGATFHPPAKSCPYCGSTETELVKLPEKGKLLHYTVLYNVPEGYRLQAPLIIGTIEVDGTRIVAQITDVEPEEVKEGMDVEAVLRRVREDRDTGLIHYAIKFRPVLGSKID
ncbi:MAG: Zn-ribbon domain-containing OB-fold protein [Desulfurococcales archaeon]|nr:Zn-ribbon domain-containing OB-fold protein [Desulfurococcales archaeon]